MMLRLGTSADNTLQNLGYKVGTGGWLDGRAAAAVGRLRRRHHSAWHVALVASCPGRPLCTPAMAPHPVPDVIQPPPRQRSACSCDAAPVMPASCSPVMIEWQDEALFAFAFLGVTGWARTEKPSRQKP